MPNLVNGITSPNPIVDNVINTQYRASGYSSPNLIVGNTDTASRKVISNSTDARKTVVGREGIQAFRRLCGL